MIMRVTMRSHARRTRDHAWKRASIRQGTQGTVTIAMNFENTFNADESQQRHPARPWDHRRSGQPKDSHDQLRPRTIAAKAVRAQQMIGRIEGTARPSPHRAASAHIE